MSQSVADNKRIARQIPEAVATEGHLDRLDDILADDHAEHGVLGETAHGVDETKAQMEAIRTAFPDFEAEVQAIIAEDDLVSMRVRLRGTHEGPFMGVAPTGKRFEVDNLVHTRIADGKIAERWVYPDVLDMFQQLGVESLPASPPGA